MFLRVPIYPVGYSRPAWPDFAFGNRNMIRYRQYGMTMLGSDGVPFSVLLATSERMSVVADMKIPQLGESVTEGLLATWLKQVGDSVDVDEPLFEVTTDKVNVEIPSDFTGVVKKIFITEGTTVQVGTVVCQIDTEE